MFKNLIILVVYIFCFCSEGKTQGLLKINSENFQISVLGNFVSSATIELNPFSNNSIDKFASEDINGGYGFGFSIKKRLFSENFYISLSTEYIKLNDDQNSEYLYYNDTNFLKVRVYETIWMVPVELSVLFDIPSISDELKIYLGGGIGVYFGDRIRRIINFETETISRTPKLNLQVLCGMEYRLTKYLSAILQVNFRTAQFNVQSRYPADRFTYQGYDYLFAKDINSKIYIDGLKVCLGLGYNF